MSQSLERVVSIVFNGVDNTGKAIDSALGNLSKAGQKVRDIAAPIADVTEKVLLAEAAAATFAIAFGVKAYDASVKFEAAQKDLAKVLNEGDPAVDSFTRGVIELSNAYGESSTNILQGIANYKQAGFTAQEASELVKNGLDLVIAGDIEAAQASELLVAILKGFKAPASDAGQILEILNATSNTYATSVEELAKGMAGLSPIADKMGLSFEDTAAVLTPVIEVFRSGDEAAVALKTGLLKLLDDSKPVQEALASIGVAQTDANGKFREGKDILFDVAAAFGTMDETQKLAFTSQLVGIDQSARMVEVFDSLANGSVDVNKALRESASVAEEVAIKLNSAEGAGKKMAAAFENLQIAIGSKFRDQMAGVVDAVGEIFREFEKAASGGALDSFFEAINPKLKDLERIAREVAAALPEALANADYSGFADGLDVLFGGLADVKVDAQDLQGVIEGIGSTFESLANFTKGVGEVFGGVITAIKPLIELFLSLDADTQKLIGTLGGAAIVIDKFGGPLAGLLGILKSFKGIGGIAGALGGAKPLGVITTALTGPAGLVVGAGAAGYAFGELINKGVAWATEGNSIGSMIYDLVNGTDDLVESQEAAAKALDEMRRAAGDSAHLDARVAAQEKAIQASKDQVDAEEALRGEWEKHGFAVDEVTGKITKMAGAQKEFSITTEDVIKATEGVGAKFGAMADALSKIERAGGPAEVAMAEMQGVLKAMANQIDPTTGEMLGLEGAISKLEAATGPLSGDLKLAAESMIDAEDATRGWKKEIIDGVTVYSQVGDAATKAGKKIVEATEKSAAATEAALDRAQAWNLKMQELASNERIAHIQAKVSLDIAEVEANAAKVVAAFESIGETMKSSGEIISSGFSALAGIENDFWNADTIEFIKNEIVAESNLRREAFEVQRNLAQAEINLMNARTASLERGDAMIKIDGAGLQPHLESFMYEILSAIQVEANAEGQEWLLGIQ